MRTVKSGAEFKQAMGDAEKMLKEDMANAMQKVSMDAFRALVRRSATDTGFLRSNWSVSVDAFAPNGSFKGDRNSKYSPATFSSQGIKWDSVVVLYNNTEYAPYLEHGTPRMAAQPMVAPTQIAVNGQLDRLAKSLSKKYYRV